MVDCFEEPDIEQKCLEFLSQGLLQSQISPEKGVSPEMLSPDETA